MSEIVERYINERVEERVEERVKECVEERVKECVEERVKERVEKEKTILVQNLMNNMKWTLDQALDALGKNTYHPAVAKIIKHYAGRDFKKGSLFSL